MWEISIIVGMGLATGLFLLRNQLRKLAVGDTEQYCCKGEYSPVNSYCQNTKPLISGNCRGFEADPLDKNPSAAESRSTKSRDPIKGLSARSLLSIEPGRTGTVLALTGGREFEAKLISMGFNVGSEVTILKNGVGGTGLLVATGDTRLAIGKGIAERIVVAVDSTDESID
ncbi:FeoA family protein [Desulfomonile tiedjei]|uniref:Fe2+ transport system protein A n=1 Tax=Desulfomonile tiedjei (strain ATCC 49306 / DSM 6799 / DCB-1) TaxID=706587 RepID=I4C0D8_DESTA|nr:FeoA domain-containing protein [Desulfomonile tiedjei]AFM23029.1 Fe2+ transport system protein A [Desulfomonile tiedjei DSM 6799]